MFINPIDYYHFHRRPSHWNNVIHSGPWGAASYHHFTAHAFSELKTLRNTQFDGINTIIYMPPFWQRNIGVLLSGHLKPRLPHVPPAVILKSLALATLCTYVGHMVSTISTGYLTSINRLLFITLIIKTDEMHYFSNLFDKVLNMFRRGSLPIIRSISALYTCNRYLSC
jgi:hypothetical protein